MNDYFDDSYFAANYFPGGYFGPGDVPAVVEPRICTSGPTVSRSPIEPEQPEIEDLILLLEV